MFAYMLVVLMAIGAVITVMVGYAFLVKIWSVNPDEFAEVRRTQGGFMSAISGKLKNPPDEFGDFRIVRGVRWNRKTGQYESQSAVSSEGFRAAFPR